MTDINPATGLAEGTFGLARLQDDNNGVFNALIKPDGAVINISSDFPDQDALYGDWPRSFDSLERIHANSRSTGTSVENYKILAPTVRPQILCAGSNYRQHAAEMYTFNEGHYQKQRLTGESDEDFFHRNLAFVEKKRAQGMPFIWLSTHGALVGPDDDVMLPAVGTAHDWEAELTIVTTGGAPRYITPDEAGDYIAGYTIGNDMHTGELFSRDDTKWNSDWIAKQPATFKQAGPFVVPKQFFPDRKAMQIELDVNGERMQDWPADDMIFSPEMYLAYASERMAILPGDLLMMGSPPGNAGVHGGRWLVPGDTMDIRITGLGRQHHRVIADPSDRTPYFGLPPFERSGDER
ncbi:2-keto-4-pentenoate hydratase/2-oxohepta-3-ene-1,7-dioic acid hydratase (catechol pathway) [Pseudarthrobacter enclensis]|uniref:Fumarylacetoacetate hydrolase n=1 Tax=Pseudarthrobacter enclensis TaxID=993070 RepID=A0A0V8I5J7_9MICC|nr:fumarylacetoacetate hydrolase family protein [Pseudarthrobacter enclensis]KSU70002.1 fumarylacetoacetate hydrolase [Pseudarthrobacter enclensis]SCC29983.1 2-keto-4-pentenoate hydratase/2-oxohepta-3-ene-1,7-dioic acid hydratase (catechol pathway) [Pseudarthrobacter enclensis]